MKNKYLKKLVSKLADVSFKDGKIIESQVIKSIKILKSQPKYQAVVALSFYLKALKRIERNHTLHVESAIPPSKEQIKKIKRAAGEKVQITKVIIRLNPQILAGFILKAGDWVWDHSIVGKVNQVKEAIIHGRPD